MAVMKEPHMPTSGGLTLIHYDWLNRFAAFLSASFIYFSADAIYYLQVI